MMGPALLEMAEHLPAHGKKLILCLALLICTASASRLSLSQPTSFPVSTLPILFSNPTGGGVSKQLPGAQLLAGIKP